MLLTSPFESAAGKWSFFFTDRFRFINNSQARVKALSQTQHCTAISYHFISGCVLMIYQRLIMSFRYSTFHTHRLMRSNKRNRLGFCTDAIFCRTTEREKQGGARAFRPFPQTHGCCSSDARIVIE